MAIRRTTHIIKNNQTNNGALPVSGIFMGEPLVNLYNGILFFSGATGGDFIPSDLNSTYFEVGSNVYDLKIRNQITSYSGVTGAGLVGKYLKGTSTGFVLDDLTNIDTFNNLFVPGQTILNNLTVTGTGIYNNVAVGSNPLEIVNFSSLTGYVQTTDAYVTGNTLTQATNNTNDVTLGLLYHGSIVGGPYSLSTKDTFTTGGTYDNSSKLITLTRNDAVQYTIDLSTIDTNDTYVTGGTTSGSSNFSPNATISLEYNQDIPNGTYSLPYNDTYVTGGTYAAGTITLTRNDGNQVTINGLSSTDTFVTGFTYDSSSNSLTISQNQGQPDLVQYINTFSGITISNLTIGQVVYVGSDGKLKTDTSGEFAYNDGTNVLTLGTTSGNLIVNNGLSDGPATFGQGGVTIGSGGSDSIAGYGDLIVHGNLVVFGTGTTISTNELYVEDPQITLNYNPTGDTSVTSIASGVKIQDGDGLGSDVYFTVAQMNTLTGLTGTQVPNVTEYTGPDGYSNRGFLTQLNDIVIRNTNLNNGAPNGVRVLAEWDVLDGGVY